MGIMRGGGPGPGGAYTLERRQDAEDARQGTGAEIRAALQYRGERD